VPLVSQVYFIKKIELEKGKNLQASQVFAICPCYEKSSFASFEGGVGRATFLVLSLPL
jgi:hypothetical protein